MRRLPNTYPGDIVKYPTKRGTISIGSADPGSKVLFYNETPVNLDLDFYNGDTDVLHAWEANFWVLDGEVSDITWAIDADSLTTTNPPINAVFATVFNPGESLGDKAYPMPLIRQLGGQVAVTGTSGGVSNEGGAINTEVIDIGTINISKLIDIFTDHFIWQVQQSGIAHQVLKGNTAGNPLQVGQAGDITEVLGNLTVDGNSIHTGTTTQTGVLTASAANLLGAIGVLTHVLGTLTVDQASTLTGVVTAPAANLLGAVGVLTSILGTLSLAGKVTTLNGGVSGTATMYELLVGVVKLLLIDYNNFKTAAAVQDLVLGTAYIRGAKVWTGDCPGSNFVSATVLQSMDTITTLSASGGSITAQTKVSAESIAEINHPFDTIRAESNNLNAHTGFMMVFGK